ncbi:MAG: SCO family protein [Magnetospirillum sp. WYHS-4]
MNRHSFLFALALALAAVCPASAKQPDIGKAPEAGGPVSRIDPESALMRAEAAIGRKISDFQFVDPDGRQVKLSDFSGKPLVLSLVYTGCFDVCPTITNTIQHSVAVARKALGRDAFYILTVGFDARTDTPQQMRAFARKQGIDDGNWLFLSGDLPAVSGLSDELGFTFVSRAGGFEHVAMVSVIDQQGAVYRQVFDENFETPHLVEPLKELVFGTRTPYASVRDFVKKVKLFCTIYDPASNTYRFDWVRIYKIVVQGMIVSAIAGYVIYSWIRLARRDRQRRRDAEIAAREGQA